MARQSISVGSAANDGTGDTLRSAGQKMNDTFVELYLKLGGDSDVLSTQISLANDGIIFEGSTPDANELTLKSENPDTDQILTLPNFTGSLIADSSEQTVTKKTFGRVAYSSNSPSSTGFVDSDATLIICDGSSDFTLTLSDGVVVGEYKIFTNKNNGVATVQPDNFRGGDNGFSLNIFSSAQCIWDGTNWFLLGSPDSNNSLVSIT